MGIKLKIYAEDENNTISFTDHTIKKYAKRSIEPSGKNEFLAGFIVEAEFWGKIDIYDKSGEGSELKKLAAWAKINAHEKEVYRKTVVTLEDVNSSEYETFYLNKSFVVAYSQQFDGEKGEGEFYILLRSLDNMESTPEEETGKA